MTCHTPKPSTDIVTYRYNSELVYVPVSLNYIQALSHAREAFPQLKKLRDASLSLSLTAPGQAQQFVGISASAWPKLVAHMSRYQIIDVHVVQPRSGRDRGHEAASGPLPIPDITITYADGDDMEETDPVPPYRKSEVTDDEKDSDPSSIPTSYPRSRSESPSPSILHPARRNWLFKKLHGNVFNAS